MRLKDAVDKLKGLSGQILPIIRYANRILRGKRGKVLLIAALKGIMFLLGIGIVYVTKYTLDKGIFAGNVRMFLFFAAAGFSLYIANVLLGYFAGKLQASLRAEFSFEVEKAVTGRLFAMDYLAVKKLSSSENSFFAGYEHTLIESLVFDDIPGLFAVFKIPVLFVLAAVLSLPMTLIVLVSIPLACAQTIWASERKRKNRQRQIVYAQKHGRVLTDFLINIKLVKTFSVEKWAVGRIVDMAYRKLTRGLASLLFSLKSGMMSTVLMRLNAFVFLVAGGLLIINGRLSFGTFSAVTMYTGLIVSAMYGFGSSLQDIYEERAGIYRCAESMNELSREDVGMEGNIAVPEAACKGDIVFSDVSFSYGEDAEVIRGLDLRVPGGKWNLLMGDSGVGKTTVIGLLMRLFPCASGTIRIGDLDLRDVFRGQSRERIVAVHQEAYMLNDTVSNNVLMGRENLSGRLEEVTSITGLDNVLDKFSFRAQAIAGERGARFSGGERQRVALARALLSRPSVLLLDEATSFLPEEDERCILDRVKAFLPETTVVIVTHRSSAMTLADNVFIMEPGGRCRQEHLSRG